MTDLLPPNATALERAVAATAARISEVPVPVDRLWNPATCPAALLPWLAWALSVDAWDAAWPEETKRQVIAASFEVHRRKGTIGALKRAIAALDLEGVSVAEWFDFGGAPHTFRLDAEVTTRGLTDQDIAALEGVVNATKNVRSHLDRLRVWLTARGAAPHLSLAAVAGEATTVLPYTPEGLEQAGQHFAALGLTPWDITTVYPEAA